MLNTGGREFEDFLVSEQAQLPSYNGKSAAARETKILSRRGSRTADLQVAERISSLLSFAEELTPKRPHGERQWVRRNLDEYSARNDSAKNAIETTVSTKAYSENGFPAETLVESPPAEDSNAVALPRRKRNPRTKARAKVVEGESARGEVNGSSDSIDDFAKSAIETTITNKPFSENGFPTEADLPQAKKANVVAPPHRKGNPRKKSRARVVDDKSAIGEMNGKSDWIHQICDDRETMMLDLRSKAGDSSFSASLEDDSKSVQNRLHSLAASLADTRAALQSGREALWQTDEVHQGALSEFIDAEDTLEFRENELMQARNELLTTRAQISAEEGNLEVEIMEARKILEEKNLQEERMKSASKHLRTARVVWPHHGNEVFLTGSFNGWNGQIKMEKSGAGVFVVSLPLYPGKYEVKFVVDGSWRVDTLRPIVYEGGFENNVLTVS